MDHSVFNTILLICQELLDALSGYFTTVFGLDNNILLAEVTFYNISIPLKDLLSSALTIFVIVVAFVIIWNIFGLALKVLRGKHI